MPESALAHLYNQPAPRLPRRLFSELQMANSLSSIASNPTNERTNEERRRLHFRVVPLFFRPRREREVSERRRRTTKNARNYAPMHHLVL